MVLQERIFFSWMAPSLALFVGLRVDDGLGLENSITENQLQLVNRPVKQSLIRLLLFGANGII